MDQNSPELIQATSDNDNDNDFDLAFAFELVRHGARTPIEDMALDLFTV